MTDPGGPVAGPLNQRPKYVVSRSLASAGWSGTTILRDAYDVAKLKTSLTGELQVHGSPGLIQSLLREGLVDELNMLVFPVTVGPGKRLFGEGTTPAAFTLVSSQATGAGALINVYRSNGKPIFGEAPPPA